MKRIVACGIVTVLLFTAAAYFKWQAHWQVAEGYASWVNDIVHPGYYVLEILALGLAIFGVVMTMFAIYLRSPGAK